MTKNFYMGAAAVVLVLLWSKGQKRDTADKALSEGTDFMHASDWQGTAWERLAGTDLGATGFPNLGTTTNASPSKNTVSALQLPVAWNGNM